MTGYGINTQNYGAKEITLKNCEFNAPNYKAIAVRDDRTSAVDTFIFEGTNVMSSLGESDKASYVLGTTDATLKAPEGANVITTVADRKVVFENGVYSLKDKLFVINGANMVLGNNLEMFFYIKKSDLEMSVDNYYAVITKTFADGRESIVKTIDGEDFEVFDAYEYRVSFDQIAAKEMTDDITVVVYDASTNEAVSHVWVDSVEKYARRLIAKTAKVKNKTFAVDMLIYGAEAQKSLKTPYNIDFLATKNLTAEELAYASTSKTYSPDAYRFISGDSSYFGGATLNLGSNIAMNFYFKKPAEGMTATVTFGDHYGDAHIINYDYADFKTSNNGTYVQVNELVVADGRQRVTFTLYDANGNELCKYSSSMEAMTAYATTQVELFKAVMRFSDSAYALFH